MKRRLAHPRESAGVSRRCGSRSGTLAAQPRTRNKLAKSSAGAMEPIARQSKQGCAETFAPISAIARAGPLVSEQG